MSEPKPVGRIAMRAEGNLWVAYWAKPDTMEDAVFLGSIVLRAVQDKARKAAFMQLMRDAMVEIFETAGEAPEFWELQPAPEHERSGSA